MTFLRQYYNLSELSFAMNLVFFGIVAFLPDRFAKYFMILLGFWTVTTVVEMFQKFTISLLLHTLILIFIIFFYFFFKTELFFNRPLYIFYPEQGPHYTSTPQRPLDKPVVLFLDNDVSKFVGAKKLGIQTLSISQTVQNPLLRGKKDSLAYSTQYKKRYPQQFQQQFQQTEEILPSVGISKNDIEYVKEWVHEHHDQRKILLLDWDRTITVKEGFSIVEDEIPPRIPGNNIEKYTKFLLGGPERFQYMKDFFIDLHENGVEIFIITNNEYCQKDNSDPKEEMLFELFLKIIQCVDPMMDRDHVLCSGKTPRKGLLSNKMNFLKSKIPQIIYQQTQQQIVAPKDR
jgi:hypothetical protein